MSIIIKLTISKGLYFYYFKDHWIQRITILILLIKICMPSLLSISNWKWDKGCTSGESATYFSLQSTCKAKSTAGVPCCSTSTVGANVTCINKNCSNAFTTLTTDYLFV